KMTTTFPYPLTIQNLMWLVFGIGVAELVIRHLETREEVKQLRLGYLQFDEDAVLELEDTGELHRRLHYMPGSDTLFLPRLVKRTLVQFHSSRSIDSASGLLNSSLELLLHEIDLRYSMLRYIMWVIPSLGFIGTVVGISLALNFLGDARIDDPDLLKKTTGNLAVAFDTTMVALFQAMLLVLGMHVVQAREESALNRIGQYCLDNLINRLYVPEGG
ncbi:MAG: MotA/TolQ/ExbB proton channel family protein, partial [Alphaproteobacteria bacterium]|nr:MotA/TolQ/ExbB proton channel family protein [Alphaproteobacteria bacterium]